MYGVALLLTVAAVGVDYGWQPGEDGQLEYIIQIEPGLIKTLSEGKVDLLSEIPEELRGVRRFRIRVGTGEVPRKGLVLPNPSQIRPEDNLADQPPQLGARAPNPNDPRAVGAQRPNDPRAAPTQPGATQPGRVLTPPGRNPNLDDPPLPSDTNRFTDNSGGAFPTLDRTPGIQRDATGAPNDRTPIDYDALQQQRNPNPTPVWDPATGQWRTPSAAAPAQGANTGAGPNLNDPRGAANNDPRFATQPPPQGAPQTGDPRDPRNFNPQAYPPQGGYAQHPQYPPAAPWQAYPYGPAPLRDPDPNYYPYPYGQRPYDPNFPQNRQVGYQTAANPNAPAPPGGNAGTSSANSGAPPAAATPVTKASTAARDLERSEEALKPWWPLTFTAMLLFASIGLNFYLGWIAHGIYQRYRALLMEVRNVRVAAM